jgi:hypothetical protein
VIQVRLKAVAAFGFDPLKNVGDVGLQIPGYRFNECSSRIRELKTDRPAVAEVPLPGNVSGPLKAIKNAGDGLRLLGKVVGYQVRLRPIERTNGEQRYCLNERDVEVTAQALVELPDRRVGGPVESGHEGEILRIIDRHFKDGSTADHADTGNDRAGKLIATFL